MKNLQSLLIFIILLLLIGCSNDNNIKSIQASGTIESTNIIVSARTAGNIKIKYFSEGNKVSAGDTILIIDHDLLDFQLQQAIAGKEITEAQLNLMLAGARKEDIKQAEEQLKQTEINFNLAKDDKNRIQNLYNTGSVTQKQYEDALAKFDLMNAQYNTAYENLNKIKRIFRPEEIQQAKANLRKSIAGVNLLKKNISDCFVISPSNGFLVKTFVEAGETVSPMSSLFKITDLDVVKLVIYVSESELGLIKLGQKAEVTTDSYKNKIYNGEVSYISPEAEFTPKNIQTKDERTKLVFAVKITVPNKDYDLKSGMPADAKVIL